MAERHAYQTKLTYQKPTAAEIQAVKEEEKERKIFRDDINEKKSKVESSRQQALKDELPFVCIAMQTSKREDFISQVQAQS